MFIEKIISQNTGMNYYFLTDCDYGAFDSFLVFKDNQDNVPPNIV